MIDLSTNRDDIEKHLKKIEKGSLSWIWFGYQNDSDMIEIVASGKSLNEMKNSTNPQRIMYGYARVTDENEKLAKFVFILWLGDASLKGKTIEFIRNGNDVSQICKPIHLKISARDENDLNWNDFQSRMFGNLSLPSPKSIFMESEEDHTPEDKVARIKQERQAEMNALIAARLVRQYARIEQRVGANYQRPDFRSEIEAARDGRKVDEQEYVGAKYDKPDFKSEIEAAREHRKRDQQESAPTNIGHASVASGKKEKSKTHAVASVSCSKDKNDTNVVGSHRSTTQKFKQGSQAINEFGTYTATTQCSDEKSYNDEAVGGAGSVEVSGRYDFTGICLFEFTAALDDEITIHPGDQITQIHQFDKKWLWGTNPSGKAGRFPKSYVEIFEDDAKNL